MGGVTTTEDGLSCSPIPREGRQYTHGQPQGEFLGLVRKSRRWGDVGNSIYCRFCKK